MIIRNLLILILISPFAIYTISEIKGTFDYNQVIEQLDMNAIKSHIIYLSTIPSKERPSRFTGYRGNEMAAEYIYNYLKEKNIQVQFENFTVTVPIDYGANITILDSEQGLKVIKAYPMLPNIVNPCPYVSPSSGDRLIYAGHADLKEFDGKEINGSIVLVEFNSRWLWKNLVAFGAKAIIFIEPEDTMRVQAEQKTFSIPINVPRLYVSREDGVWLREMCNRQKSLTISLKTQMLWENRVVSNIVGFIPGTNPSLDREAIVLAAHYDSYSIVPSISPGATDALNVAVLLELAKYFSQNRPPRPSIFLATNGYWQGLMGGRDFIDNHFSDLGFKIKLFFNLDLCTDSDALAIIPRGSLFAYRLQPIETRFAWIRDRIFSNYIPTAQRNLGKQYNVIDGIYPITPLYEPTPILFEGELFSLAMFGGGLAFHTTNCLRYYLKTPLDTYDRLNLENLRPQAEAILIIMKSLLEEPSFSRNLPYSPTRFSTDWGFSTLRIYVTQYNMTQAWYDPFKNPDAIVRIAIPISTQVSFGQMQFLGTMSQGELIGAGAIGSSGVIGAAGTIYMNVFMIPDENATVFLKGVKPYTTGLVEAYVINKTTGGIEYAPDHGTYAFKDALVPSGVGVANYYIYKQETTKVMTLFKSGSIALLNILNPVLMVYEGTVQPLNFLSHGFHIWYGVSSHLPEAILFVPPETKTEIVIRSNQMRSTLGGFYYPYLVLTNASSKWPTGFGYTVKAGEVLLLTNPIYLWEEFHRINWNRVETALAYHTYNEQVDSFSKLSLQEYELAKKALSNNSYSEAFTHITFAWGYESLAYNAMVDMTLDIIITTAFSLLILIPYTIFFERLFFNIQEGRPRIICILSTIALFIVILSLNHPGPRLATNLPMILMGFGVIFVIIPVIAFSIGEAQSTISEMQKSSIGLHFASISRVGIFAMALSTGIQQMRRRKLRTALTLTSVIITTFALIAFTSIATTIVVYEAKKESQYVPYDGFMIRKMPWAPITEHFLLALENRYGRETIVAPRGWVYPPMQRLSIVGIEPAISGLVAIKPEEENVTGLAMALVEGRFFTASDRQAIILAEGTARKYDIKLGSNITILGIRFQVIGFISAEAYSQILELDGAPITPLDNLAAIEMGAAGTLDVRLSAAEVALIPFKFAQEIWNILPMTISIKFEDPELATKEAMELSRMIPFDIYAGRTDSETLSIFRAHGGIHTVGTEGLLLPFLISGFMIVNMMLGAVYERTREINIFGVVGLAPIHIMGMFLAESIAYAFLGGVLGYYLGIIGINILGSLNAIPQGLTPNFAASFIVVAISFSMSMVIVSTIYPALKAGRMITPYTERKFKISTKPKGDRWDIPLPFVATEDEVDGLIYYIKEYYDAHSAPGVAVFVASNIKYGESKTEEAINKVLSATLWLKPFDMGIYEKVMLIATRAKGSASYNFELSAERESGVEQAWLNCHRVFVNEIRKQFLIWRALRPEEKDRYVKLSKRELRD